MKIQFLLQSIRELLETPEVSLVRSVIFLISLIAGAILINIAYQWDRLTDYLAELWRKTFSRP